MGEGMKPKFNVWLNACIVASYVQKQRALNKAMEIMKSGKYNSEDDELYVLAPCGDVYKYL